MFDHSFVALVTHSFAFAYFRPVQMQLLLLVLNRCFVVPMLQSELLLAATSAAQMLPWEG